LGTTISGNTHMATDNFPVVDDVPSGNGFVGEPPDDQLDGISLIVHKRWCIVSGKRLSTFGGYCVL
jgi:hypothetical protein